MRVAFYGAICVPIWTALSQHSELDAHLYIDDRNELLETAYRSLRDNRDPRLHVERWQTRPALVRPSRAALVEEWRDFDILVVSELGPLFARHTGRYWCFLPSGGDLTIRPFALRYRYRLNSIAKFAAAALISFRQRAGIRRADEIWAPPWAPFLLALRRLGVPNERLTRDYFPIGIDSRIFAANGSSREAARRRLPLPVEREDFVVFHPSRLMMDRTPFQVETGQWKNNEMVFEALALLRQRNLPRRLRLALIDQRYSPDRDRARQLIESLDLNDAVVWVSPSGAAGFDLPQMRDLYLQADVVLDDPGVGWFGSVVVEALALGVPVVTHVQPSIMQELYPWHPILLAETAEEIASRIEQLVLESMDNREVLSRGPEWVDAFHSAHSIAARYEAAILHRGRRFGLGS